MTFFLIIINMGMMQLLKVMVKYNRVMTEMRKVSEDSVNKEAYRLKNLACE